VALGHIVLSVLQFVSVSNIPSMLYFHVHLTSVLISPDADRIAKQTTKEEKNV
jgi:uncharacterized membrane protein YccF (DUF307 family)